MARHEITFKRVVYEIEGMTSVPVQRDLEYATSAAGPLTMDLYRPHDTAPDARLPAVVIVGGYPDVGVPMTLGCSGKEMEMVISWAQLIAASGMIAIAYTRQDPAADLVRVIDYVRANAAALGIDAPRIAIYAASGNGPVGLSLLIQDSQAAIACAVMVCCYTLDAGGSTGVADAAATWKFVNATAGKSVADLSSNVPLMVVRAGADQFAGLNPALDRFVADALARDLPLTVVNHAGAPHGFELFDPTDRTRAIVRRMLAFLREELLDR